MLLEWHQPEGWTVIYWVKMLRVWGKSCVHTSVYVHRFLRTLHLTYHWQWLPTADWLEDSTNIMVLIHGAVIKRQIEGLNWTLQWVLLIMYSHAPFPNHSGQFCKHFMWLAVFGFLCKLCVLRIQAGLHYWLFHYFMWLDI